ncbi:MAG: class I SAM-dependent methyltransferase [Muribaculaceae bacterium]|nr:class I SAM-dependent methyltransferase [Muribaculaceae bacterium]
MTQEEIEFFNRIAPDWDGMECRSLPHRINHILDMMDIREGMKVADLGTGTGVLLPYLSGRVGPDGIITAIDGASGMLDIARKKYEKPGGNIRFLLNDFEEKMPSERFDIIILYCVYPHLQHKVQTLRTLKSDNLNKGGAVFIAFPNDESFVNHIHEDKKSTADLLPSAPALALELFDAGFSAKVLEYSEDAYLLRIS